MHNEFTAVFERDGLWVIASLTQDHCARIAHHLNQRPRKRLGFRTPQECFYDR